MQEWTEADSRALTVALVARDGHRMRLLGAARREVVQEMIAQGQPVEEIAYRLLLDLDSLQAWARRNQIALPSAYEPQPWWVVYWQPSKSTEARRRQRREQLERKTRCSA